MVDAKTVSHLIVLLLFLGTTACAYEFLGLVAAIFIGVGLAIAVGILYPLVSTMIVGLPQRQQVTKSADTV